MLVASVAVEKTAFCFDRLYSYIIPDELLKTVKIGSFVLVPFGIYNYKRQAVVMKIEKKKKLLG